ncbi:hypothetical protein Tco_0991191 [Tanacetum coccineum]|uniref:Reverse transcriptase domain-containing protein n=1 Tax=Tanacetum coccineum TaxID=301880 RepID=A0ABQ5F001_9ASTR
MLRGLDQLMERKEDGGMKFIWVPLIDDVRILIMDEAHASRYLVHPGTDKTYYDLRDMYGGHVWRRILLPIVEVGDKVMLEVSSWKEVVHFGKKEILALRHKYLADTNMHVHLEEIKVPKLFVFWVKILLRLSKRRLKVLKRSRIPIVFRMAQQVIPAAQLVPRYHTIGRCNNYVMLLMDVFRAILKLPVETPDNPLVARVTIEIIESFMNKVGYQGVVDKVSAFYTKNLTQPWQTMFKVFSRCLTTRTSGHD